ncbi:MAG: TIGR00730 family Rossman fold protein [Candidatus Taylorbacteria bacterium]
MPQPKPHIQYEDMRKDIHRGEILEHLERIRHEFADSFEFLRKYPKSVTIFGSSQIGPESEVYKQATELAYRISKETSYAILTGGGPGTMEAANKGAFDAGGKSLGFNISLPHNHTSNEYMTENLKFSYFFARKAMMTFTAEAYVFLPGGFGTFDELFSVLTLIQTGKIPRVPVILFNSLFWNEVREFLKKTMLNEFHTIKERDLELFTIVDSVDQALDIIKNAPVSEWWRNIN